MSFSIYTGVLSYGSFGGGTTQAPALIPLNSGEDDYCDYTDRKMLMNGNQGTGGGNFACDGCDKGKKAEEWDIQEIKTSEEADYSEGDISGGLVIWWEDDTYKVQDSDGNDLGTCTWAEPSETQKCTIGALDVYEMALYMECELDVDLQWE